MSRFSDGEWYNLRVKLGGWRGRLEPFRHIITPDVRKKIIHNFAMSWGFRESDIVGRHKVDFVRISKVAAVPPTSPNAVPSTMDMWDMQHVAVQVADIIKRKARLAVSVLANLATL